MAPGFFKKIGDFFKKAVNVCKKALPVVKKLAPMITPLLKHTPLAPITKYIEPGLELADKFLGKGGGVQQGLQHVGEKFIGKGGGLISNRIKLKN